LYQIGLDKKRINLQHFSKKHCRFKTAFLNNNPYSETVYREAGEEQKLQKTIAPRKAGSHRPMWLPVRTVPSAHTPPARREDAADAEVLRRAYYSKDNLRQRQFFR
jgi:hypothetical protein